MLALPVALLLKRSPPFPLHAATEHAQRFPPTPNPAVLRGPAPGLEVTCAPLGLRPLRSGKAAHLVAPGGPESGPTGSWDPLQIHLPP